MSLTTGPCSDAVFAGGLPAEPATPSPLARDVARSTTRTAAHTAAGYRHEGVVRNGVDELLAHAVPFVTEGLDDGGPVVVALSPTKADRLRDALGPDAAHVRFTDPDARGRSPVRKLQGWLDLIAQHDGTAQHDDAGSQDLRPHHGIRHLRALTEPVRPDHRPAEIAESQLHEAVLNLAIPTTAPLWLMCLYDADTLAPSVLSDACRSHPRMSGSDDDSTDHDRPAYEGPDYARRLSEHALPEPSGEVDGVGFTLGGLSLVRHRVALVAAREGVDSARIDDLIVAINEVAANSLDHGGGRGELRYWREPGALVLEVRDAGLITDPLVGRIGPVSEQSRGRGLWMANQFGDLLQIRSNGAGTTVRISTWL